MQYPYHAYSVLNTLDTVKKPLFVNIKISQMDFLRHFKIKHGQIKHVQHKQNQQEYVETGKYFHASQAQPGNNKHIDPLEIQTEWKN